MFGLLTVLTNKLFLIKIIITIYFTSNKNVVLRIIYILYYVKIVGINIV